MESLYQKMKWVLFIVVIALISQPLTNFIIADVKAFNNTENLSNSTNSSVTNSSMNLNETKTIAAVNGIKHVIIIVMENKGYTEIIGSSDAPYQNKLAKKYASASKYYGVFPDSLPNYIAIISGYPYLTNDKDPGTLAPLKEQTIVNLLQSKNMTWKGYFEDMPDTCHLKDSGKSGYIVHHNPFVYFDIRNDYRCKNTVPLDIFYKDLLSGSLPNFSFVVPNNIHDSHDSTVADGDKWLSTSVPKIINSTAFNNTALVIVYDEGQKHDKSGFGSGQYSVTGGRLPLILVSPFAKEGFVTTNEYTHYNLLSTIETMLDLGNLSKGDAISKPMMDLMRSEG
jgi:phosphatidylinositol-3-phosphatase